MAKQPPTKAAPAKKTALVKAAPSKSAPVKSAPKADAAPAVAEKYGHTSLVDDVHSKLPVVSRATIDRVVLSTFEAVSAAFMAGKVVNIKDFGRMEVKHRPERQGRNPATGATLTIAAKTIPKFTFAKKLKEAAQ